MAKGPVTPRPRRDASGSDALRVLFDFDLLAAAYHWDRFIIWKLTGHSPDALRAMRNHEIPVPEDLSAFLERLWTLHYELWFSFPQPYDYHEWWNRTWGFFSPIGETTPLLAVAENPMEALDLIINHYRAGRSGDYS